MIMLLRAKKVIEIGDEITFDYKDNRSNGPEWMKNS